MEAPGLVMKDLNRYWYHPESESLFRTYLIEDEERCATLCYEVTREEYEMAKQQKKGVMSAAVVEDKEPETVEVPRAKRVRQELINKYRPESFDQVIGHDAVVNSLEGAIKKGTAHAFLFTGPPGTGKTTLARLAAEALGCAHPFEEIDGPTHSSVEEMRAVTSGMVHIPLSVGEKSNRAIIVDEAHAISAKAWQSVLKSIEEPPSHVYWFFATTELGKVPEAIKSRCLRYDLKPLPRGVIVEFLDFVAEQEAMKLPPGVVELCANEAKGSPRSALSNLAVASEAVDRKEAAALLSSVEEDPQVIDLARGLLKGIGWSEARTILEGLKDTSAESIRQVVRGFMTSVILKSDKPPQKAFAVLEEFSTPFYNTSDGISPVVLAVGRLLLGQR